MTVVAGPVIGEFGFGVFYTAPHVHAWFARFPDHERLVCCPNDWQLLFPRATGFIIIPDELMPQPACGTTWQTWKHVGRPNRSRRPGAMRMRFEPGQAGGTPELQKWFNQQMPPGAQVLTPPALTAHRGSGETPYRVAWPGAPGLKPEYPKYSGLPPVSGPSIVIAARRRLEFGPLKNWPPPDWDELCRNLKKRFPGFHLLSVGSRRGSYFPAETTACHGLRNSIAALSNAVCSISSNSGTTHLSLMCDCPTFSWGENTEIVRYRMEKYSNPHGTMVEYQGVGWRAKLDWAIEAATSFIERAVDHGLTRRTDSTSEASLA